MMNNWRVLWILWIITMTSYCCLTHSCGHKHSMWHFLIFRVDNIRSFASASQQGSLLCAHVMIGILSSKKWMHCSIIITSLIEKFARKFLNQEFMNIIKIIYPQHLLNFNAKNTFLSLLAWSFSWTNETILFWERVW